MISRKKHNSLRMLEEMQARLIPAYGKRFEDIILYGSAAEGRMRADSDIDVIILLKGPVRLWSDLKIAIQALFPLTLKYGHPISPKPVNTRDYMNVSVPLFQSVREKGIRLA